MPSYRRDGKVELAFASQKQYIALYVMKSDVVDRYRDRFPTAKIGKGCIRFTSRSTSTSGLSASCSRIREVEICGLLTAICR